jgi:hypothetical protein
MKIVCCSIAGNAASIGRRLKGSLMSVCTLLLLLVVTGCGSSGDRTGVSAPSHYFDLAGLVERQIDLLEREKPSVEKIVNMNGKGDTVTTKAINWREELGFFLQADINKPSYDDSYLISSPDPQTEVYRLKEGVVFPVREMLVKKEEDNGEVREIVVQSTTKNRLFDTDRHLTLRFSGEGASLRLVSYQVLGTHKLAIGEGDHFEVRGRVNPL